MTAGHRCTRPRYGSTNPARGPVPCQLSTPGLQISHQRGISAARENFLVAPPQPHNYRTGHPATASLVIEVAGTSRGRDLGLKASLYAAGGVPDYWVVDLRREEIVVHRDPAATTFDAVTRHRDGVVWALHHPRLAVDVRALLR